MLTASQSSWKGARSTQAYNSKVASLKRVKQRGALAKHTHFWQMILEERVGPAATARASSWAVEISQMSKPISMLRDY